VKLSELFSTHKPERLLSSSSIHSSHRVISAVLSKAVKWGFIPYNPAFNAELPKFEQKKAPYLDEEDARRLLSLLHNEPIKYRTMISFDLLSGLRRGELLGLRWCDVDFSSETITIVQTSNYVRGRGIYVDKPKNKTSVRPLKLSRSAFIMLQKYKGWQDEQREACGDCWKQTDERVFTADDGALIHPDSLTKWFKSFVKRHGFPDVHLHSLRHTYASILIADGTPLVVVSENLGHAQVSTTHNIYSHAIQSAKVKATQVFDKYADVIDARPESAEIHQLKQA
jgi:integrase